MLDAHERRLLLAKGLVQAVLARMRHEGLTPAKAAEAEVKERLTHDVPTEVLEAVERAINDTLARVSPEAMTHLFAGSHEFGLKRLSAFFAPILTQLEAATGPSPELARLGAPHLRAWHWEADVLRHRRFVASGGTDFDAYLQQAPFWRPDLEAKPIWQLDELPGAYRELERAAPDIQAELDALRREQGWLPYRGWSENELAHASDVTEGSAWHAFFFYHPLKGRFGANHARCPVTSQVLEALPGLCRREIVLFSALAPGSIIPPHQGPFNGRLRVHLALTGTKGCYLRVGTQIRTWEDGKVLVFDDSFEHQVCHTGSELRVVLLMNVLQPGLDPKRSSVDALSLTNPVHYAEDDEDRRGRESVPVDWWR
jgi:hypothetical protein